MSNYPENIDSFAPVTGSDEMTEHAERHTAEESSIVAIENTLGTSPEGDSDTVADRLDAQDTLIADNADAISGIDTTIFATSKEVAEADQLLQGQIDAIPPSNTYRLETDANTRSVPQIQLVDQDDNFSDVVFNAGEGISITSVGSGLNFALGEGVIPDVSGFATTTEVEAADAATLEAANEYTDEEVAKIVVPDVSTFATTEYVDEADGALQEQIDAIETYDDTVLSAQVDTNTQTLAALTTATLPLDEPEDPTAVFATLSTQLDANQYFAQELETKVTEGTTWGALAGRA